MSTEAGPRTDVPANGPSSRAIRGHSTGGAGRTLTLLLSALVGCAGLAAGKSTAAPSAVTPATASAAPEVPEISEPMRIAIVLARAAGGVVGFVGSALALDETSTPVEAAIIQPVAIERMRTGEILMLVQDGCKSPLGCLMARRIIEKRGSDVATQRYGRRPAGEGKEVDASVLGRVAYVVNLDTGRIRDMRKDDTREILLVEALRRESRKWHYTGNTVRPRPVRT